MASSSKRRYQCRYAVDILIMTSFNVKMTSGAREYILGYWSEDELLEALEKYGNDPVRLGREFINRFFRDRNTNGGNYQLIQISRTRLGEVFYKLMSEPVSEFDQK